MRTATIITSAAICTNVQGKSAKFIKMNIRRKVLQICFICVAPFLNVDWSYLIYSW